MLFMAEVELFVKTPHSSPGYQDGAPGGPGDGADRAGWCLSSRGVTSRRCGHDGRLTDCPQQFTS